jgi:hypothetical protein
MLVPSAIAIKKTELERKPRSTLPVQTDAMDPWAWCYRLLPRAWVIAAAFFTGGTLSCWIFKITCHSEYELAYIYSIDIQSLSYALGLFFFLFDLARHSTTRGWRKSTRLGLLFCLLGLYSIFMLVITTPK